MNDFTYNGTSLSSFGFCIANTPQFNISKRSFETVQIVGMDGVAISDNGIYEAVETVYEVNSIPYRVPYLSSSALYRALAEWLTAWDGQFKIMRDTYNEGYFYKAICTKIEPITEIANKCLKTSITFTRQPFLYSDDGQKSIAVDAAENSLGVNFTLHNPENFNSQPYIKVYGEGAVSVDINGNKFNILRDFSDYIEIDSEIKHAHKGAKNCNNLINCNYMPELIPGENTIIIQGAYDSGTSKTGKCTRVEIVPRWRRL